MFAEGQKRRFCRVRRPSAFPPIATGADFGPMSTSPPHDAFAALRSDRNRKAAILKSWPSSDFVQLGS